MGERRSLFLLCSGCTASERRKTGKRSRCHYEDSGVEKGHAGTKAARGPPVVGLRSTRHRGDGENGFLFFLSFFSVAFKAREREKKETPAQAMRSLDAVRARPCPPQWVWMAALVATAATLGVVTWLTLVMAGTTAAAKAAPVDCRPCAEVASTPTNLFLLGAVVGFAACALATPLRDTRRDAQTVGIVRVATAAA
ncbi:hypothetical protein [Pandoravirus japonicus]|uniref:Uncharacterized protein n=1 Tax=Pandoravirus japonicus TaxID=2823154 RepID=A0A811BRP0_9VIRU|nr:hypothetical protein [Pandoravirus japonicus]